MLDADDRRVDVWKYGVREAIPGVYVLHLKFDSCIGNIYLVGLFGLDSKQTER
jgi:hypothetical protein